MRASMRRRATALVSQRQKKKQNPYCKFMQETLAKKDFHPEKTRRERFSLAAKAWGAGRERPKKQPGEYGCGKCRGSICGCASCNPEKKDAYLKRKREKKERAGVKRSVE